MSDNPLKSNVTEKYSYVFFTNKIFVASDMSVSIQSYLGLSDANGITQVTDKPEVEGTKDGLIFRRGRNNYPNNVIEHGTGIHTLVMKGSARRVTYPVDIPYIHSVGIGNPSPYGDVEEPSYPVLLKDRLLPNQLVRYTPDGEPIYAAAWERMYVLPSLNNREIKFAQIGRAHV